MIQKKFILVTNGGLEIILVTTCPHSHTCIMNNNTPINTPIDNTDPPQNPSPSKKRPLESAAAEFTEKGWKLVADVFLNKQYPFGEVKSMPIGEPKGIYKNKTKHPC